MPKKRKAGGRSFTGGESRNERESDSKLRINTFEDVADSEDEFHINRDKILLEEGSAQKRQRKVREEEEFLEPSDEEVLAASEATSEDDFEDDEDTPIPSRGQHDRLNNGRVPRDSDSEASAAPEEDEDVGGWGASKKDYYNADIIETEADAFEEEAEARRLQQKQLQGMTEADFGFDEVDWLEAGKDSRDEEIVGQGKVIREVLPRIEITDTMGPDERTKILKTRYPEFEPLAKEFLDLQIIYDETKMVAAKATKINNHTKDKVNDSVDLEESPTSFAVIKHNILAAYLASLSMYFALLTSGEGESNGNLAAMPPEELRDHAIMETLVQSRDLWQKVKDIVVPEPHDPDDDETRSISEQAEVPQFNGVSRKPQDGEEKRKKRKHRKSKAQKAAEAAQAEAETIRAARLQKTEEELASLSALTAPSNALAKSNKPLTPTIANKDDSSDFGEATTLTPHEAAEKASRKKSLRFYTSQITQKANKRGAAGRDAGGDADIPYRERLKDRQERLNAEAEKRGKKPKVLTKGDHLGGPSDEEDHAAVRDLRNGDDSDSENYYDLIASRAASKKAAKAAARAQALDQDPNTVRIVDDKIIAEDGKRGISYQIEKNRGITPKRKKEQRNPRVKKRKKFEDKKKKLGSVRAVYKGGEGRGGYGGELTGIKKGLVKSVKL